METFKFKVDHSTFDSAEVSCVICSDRSDNKVDICPSLQLDYAYAQVKVFMCEHLKTLSDKMNLDISFSEGCGVYPRRPREDKYLIGWTLPYGVIEEIHELDKEVAQRIDRFVLNAESGEIEIEKI